MGKVVSEAGDNAQMLLIFGVDFEPIERYVGRQNEMANEVAACEHAVKGLAGDQIVAIDGATFELFDTTRPMLLDFLAATKRELERQMRDMPLVVRIRTEEEEEEEEEEEASDES